MIRLSLYGLLAVAFVSILLLQLFRNIVIDTYDLERSRLDLLGFAICHSIAVALITAGVLARRVMIDALLISIILIIYIAIVVAITSPNTSLLALLVSRYGILNWYLIGLGAAAAASYIHIPDRSFSATVQKRAFLIVGIITCVLLATFSFNYISSPVFSISYQSVSDSLTIALLLLMIFTQIVWKGSVPVPVLMGVLVAGSIAVTAVARMQSTAIVGFWLVGLIIYSWGSVTKLAPKYKLLFVLAAGTAVALYLSSDLFVQTLANTRFANVLAGGGLSSVDSRLDLLSDFAKQFSVSPILGNFAAEIRAGTGSGYYVHSLILSFLTHTGLVGTTILGILLVLIYSRRLPIRYLAPPDLQQLLLMSAVLLLGTLYTFMTWSVFWFILGFMCKMPTAKAAGEAR